MKLASVTSTEHKTATLDITREEYDTLLTSELRNWAKENYPDFEVGNIETDAADGKYTVTIFMSRMTSHEVL